MPIVEEFMDTGSWSVNLQDDTPRWVLDDITVIDHLWASIVITPHHWTVGDISDANLLSLARYAGVFLGMGEGRRSLWGEGLMWWLGDSGDGGFIFASTDTTTASIKLDTALDTHIFTASNGLTKGTVDGSETYYQFGLEGGDTRREIFDTIIQQSDEDTVWQVTPAGVININLDTVLYPSTTTPTAVLISEGSREGNVDGIPAEIRIAGLDGTEVREKVWVDWQDGTNNGSSTLSLPTGWKDYAGAAPEVRSLIDWRPKRPRPPTERWRKLAAWQIRSLTQANSLAAREINERSEIRNEIRVDVDEYDPWRFDISPGNWVYIMDEDSRIVDTANSVQYQGEVIHPKKSRVEQWQTPIQEGYGVYLRYYNGSSMAFYDLTEWVAWEDDFTSMQVGHRDRFAAPAVASKVSKAQKKRFRRAARYAAGKLYTHSLDERWSNPDNIRGYRQLHAPPPQERRR